jgi:hypothetical protein
VTGAGRVEPGAEVFGVVLMAGSFGGTRPADPPAPPDPRCLSPTYTRNQKLAIYF